LSPSGIPQTATIFTIRNLIGREIRSLVRPLGHPNLNLANTTGCNHPIRTRLSEALAYPTRCSDGGYTELVREF